MTQTRFCFSRPGTSKDATAGPGLGNAEGKAKPDQPSRREKKGKRREENGGEC